MATMQQLLVAVRRKLIAYPAFTSLVGVDVGKDPAGKAYSDGWVFKSFDNDFTPDRNPRNTGLSTVTYGWRDPWTAPNAHNTARFPHLEFRILSDSTRPTDKTLTKRKDADYRCDRIGSVITSCFNDVANRDHWWSNDVFVVSSILWDDLRITNVEDTDGLVLGELSFALEI